MQFYSWQLTGVIQQQWENHVFLKYEYMKGPHTNPRNPRTDCFVSLCEHPLRGRGGHSGESKNEYYCPRCAELAPIFEAEAQEKERKRVADLEMRRPEMTQEVNSIINAMHIDELVKLLSSFKWKK